MSASQGSYETSDIGDHCHSDVTLDNGEPIRTTNFDFASLDPEIPSLVPISTVSEGFIRILQWIQSGAELKTAGARAAALGVFLDPVNNPFKNLSEISRASGICRATLSKALMDLRDSCDLRLSLRLPSGRQNCRQAQLSAIERGTHSSNFTRKNHINGDHMNTVKDSPRERLRTLDQAVQECEKLEAELTKLRATNASQLGIDNQILVRASAPVTRVRQIANWCNGTPHKDQQEELKALQQLPAKWLASLRSLIQQESNAGSSHS